MNQARPGSRRLASALLTSLAFLLLAPVARAQDPAPVEVPDLGGPPVIPTPTTPALTESPPAAPVPASPPPEPAPPPTTPPAPALEKRVSQLEAQVAGLDAPWSALSRDVAALKRIKVGGYIQGRYEWHGDANYGIEGTTPRETNRFLVRRGRLQTTYTGDMTEFFLQIDATGDGVVLKDAEASFVLNNENAFMPGPTPWQLKLTVGQFKVPFGFEVLQNSDDREMPERARVIATLFPGERDRGARLQYSRAWFKLMAAVINGNFTTDPIHTTYDQSSWKDVVGRVAGDWRFLAVGLSAHVGRFLKAVRLPTTAMPVAGYERYSRLRLGADAQGTVDIPGLGALVLMGEAIWARDKQMDFGGVAKDPMGCKDTDAFGWIATLVQHIGQHAGVVVRVDQFDPTASLGGACTNWRFTDPAAIDKVTDLGGGLIGYVSATLKASLIYEHLAEQSGAARANDVLTVQMQAKF